MHIWVFDNDGTLYDDSGTEQAFMTILWQFLSERTRMGTDEVKPYLDAIKQKWETKFSVVAIANELAIDIDTLIKDLYLSLDLTQCDVRLTDPDIPEVVSQLGQRRAVLTNNPSNFAKQILSHVEIAHLFEKVIGMTEVNYQLKPQKNAYSTLELAFPEADSFTLVDDRSENVAGAVNAGWVGVLFDRGALNTPYINTDGIQVVSRYSELVL